MELYRSSRAGLDKTPLEIAKCNARSWAGMPANRTIQFVLGTWDDAIILGKQSRLDGLETQGVLCFLKKV